MRVVRVVSCRVRWLSVCRACNRCDRKERKRAYNDRLFAIRGLPDSLYVFASSGPRRLEKGE